jgi:hypothetical protein
MNNTCHIILYKIAVDPKGLASPYEE